MIVSHLALFCFRNYAELRYTPHSGITVIHGPNGAGKTNLLEALHFASVGRSHRAAQDREMMRAGAAFTSVRVRTERIDGRHDVELKLANLRTRAKRVLIAGKQAQRVAELMGHVTCVLFSPEDLRLVTDGPQLRRRYLDMQLSQMRPSYLNALSSYATALAQRNAVLHDALVSPARDAAATEALLLPYDELLARYGALVTENRLWFFQEMSERVGEVYADVSARRDARFSLAYHGALAKNDMPYRTMLETLARVRQDDLRRGFTTFGPHRDDFSFLLGDREMRTFASQGQIRTAALSLKLAQIGVVFHDMGEYPALLLDDVFSELDPERRRCLLEKTKGLQTLLTCTDLRDAEGVRADATLRVENDPEGARVFPDE